MSGAKATAEFHIALNAEAGVPAEINLLPAGAIVRTVDGRGPYRIADAAALVAASLAAASGRPMPIDENHALDLAAPKGGPSPARGWMTGLQARADGSIWAPVEWTGEGKQLVGDKAYRGVSVVFSHLKDGTITQIMRASLVNNPNLRGVVALNAEGANMDLLADLRKLLGLPDDADAAAVCAKVKSLQDAGTVAAQATALQASIVSIAQAAGLTAEAKPDAVLAAVTTLATTAKAAPGAEAVVALQAELKDITTKFTALQAGMLTASAVAFVDGAIRRGHVGVKPLRDHYIAMHAVDPARVEKEIGAMPTLGPSGALTTPPENKDGKVALNAEQQTVARMLGQTDEQYAKTLAAEQGVAAA